MDFTFNEDQQAVIDAVKEFCAEELAPKAKETDEACRWPAENVAKLGELDLMGIPVPEEYGGLGMDFLTWAAVGEELSRGLHHHRRGLRRAHALRLSDHALRHRRAEEEVPDSARQGRARSAPSASPSRTPAPTRPRSRTKADRDGDHYILNGTKIFITNGGEAETYVIIANVDPSKRRARADRLHRREGHTRLRVRQEREEDGLPVAAEPGADLHRLPRAEREHPRARATAASGSRCARSAWVASAWRSGAVGLAQAALEAAVPYSKQREQFGKPISSFQAIQFMLADMATEVDAARLLTWRAAWLKDQGKPFEKEAAMAKLYASEAAMRVTTKAVQIFGGYGYTKEFPVERYMREAKLFEIVEGTSEIQRLVIANHVLRGVRASEHRRLHQASPRDHGSQG